MSDRSIPLDELKPGAEVFMIDFSLLSSECDTRGIYKAKVNEIEKTTRVDHLGSHTYFTKVTLDQACFNEERLKNVKFFNSKEDLITHITEQIKNGLVGL